MSADSEARTSAVTVSTSAWSARSADQVAATIPASTIRASVRRR
ncbi:hypothetical protein ACFWJY_36370 [Streptomyces anulatus]